MLAQRCERPVAVLRRDGCFLSMNRLRTIAVLSAQGSWVSFSSKHRLYLSWTIAVRRTIQNHVLMPNQLRSLSNECNTHDTR